MARQIPAPALLPRGSQQRAILRCLAVLQQAWKRLRRISTSYLCLIAFFGSSREVSDRSDGGHVSKNLMESVCGGDKTRRAGVVVSGFITWSSNKTGKMPLLLDFFVEAHHRLKIASGSGAGCLGQQNGGRAF
jgi:hypothetical protein